MTGKIAENVRISFEGAFADDPSPLVVVYNPRLLSFALWSQLVRFGLGKTVDSNLCLSGKLKGSRKDFMHMIQSYGFGVEIVRNA